MMQQSATAAPKSLTMPRSIYNAIIDQARAGKPEEICGLLRGRDSRVSGLYPAVNVAPNRIMDYEVDPAALLVQFDWEEEGDALIAIYHSHPVSPAYPSASDAFNAYYPDAVYLICSLQEDDHPILNGFFMRDVAGEWDLETARAELAFDETRPGRWGAYLGPDEPTPPGLAALLRAVGLAMYVVYQAQGSDDVYARAVSVEPVDISVR